jgi:hypothetical protein
MLAVTLTLTANGSLSTVSVGHDVRTFGDVHVTALRLLTRAAAQTHAGFYMWQTENAGFPSATQRLENIVRLAGHIESDLQKPMRKRWGYGTSPRFSWEGAAGVVHITVDRHVKLAKGN